MLSLWAAACSGSGGSNPQASGATPDPSEPGLSEPGPSETPPASDPRPLESVSPLTAARDTDPTVTSTTEPTPTEPPPSLAPPITTATPALLGTVAERTERYAPILARGECPAPPARTQPRGDRPRYDVTMDIRPEEGLVDGALNVVFTPDRDVDRLVFRLWPNGPRLAGVGTGVRVFDPTVGGASVDMRMIDPTTVELDPGRTVSAGTSVTIGLGFELRVAASVRGRVSTGQGSMRLGSIVPTLPWEPGVGWALEPPTSGFAESVSSPTADYLLRLSVTEGFEILASGATTGNGIWTADAMRDVGISVGRFATAARTVPQEGGEPIEVTVGVHDSVGENPEVYLDRVARSLADFAVRFGPYPWPTFSLAITPDLSGGIEFPSHVQQGPGSSGRTTPHEVGHQWFYALVGNNQGRDPWLDEGLATFAEGHIEGTLGGFAGREIPSAGRGRAGEPMAFWEANLNAYYRSVYVQTAAALTALGPPWQVDCALRHHTAINSNRIATTGDFLDAVEPVLPGASETLAGFGIGR